MIVNQKTLHNLRALTDLAILNICFIFSGILAQSLDILLSKNMLFILLILSNGLWYFSARLTKLYDDITIRLFSTTFLLALKNSLTQVVFAALYIFFSKELLFTRNFIIFYGSSLTVFILIKHFIFQRILIKSRKLTARKLAIIGAGDTAVRFKDLLESHPEFGYKFAGFVSYDKIRNQNTIGGIEELDKLIKENSLSDIVVAIPIKDSDLIDDIIKVCDKNAAKCFIIPDYFKFISKKFSFSLFSDFPIITVRISPLEEAQNRFIKRIFDFSFSLIILVLFLWWLIPLISLAVKLSSKGPVFFIQERVGIDEKPIKVYKFRTMTIEASSEKNSIKPISGDDRRITAIGKILRKANLDELPQFINVLKGSMSIVGPRPHTFAFNELYRDIVEEIKLRNRIKPGITGWAQIHGLRGDVEDEKLQKIRTRKRIEYDIWYIENWTFWLDVQIIFETFLQAVSGKNLGN